MCGSGFEVKVITPETYVRRDSGLIYWDIEVGNGDFPKDGQQVFTLLKSTIYFLQFTYRNNIYLLVV